MKRTLIVLRQERDKAAEKEFEHVGAGIRRTSKDRPVSAGVEKISRADVENDKTIIAAAPPMPIRLIRPMKRKSAKPTSHPKVTWGIEAIKADKIAKGGAGVTVAVLDTGIDLDHPAFKDPALKIITKNFTNETDKDVDGHGTHCAGTIFGRDVDGTRIGIAKGVTKALIAKVLPEEDDGSTEGLIQAIYWAMSEGAHVISMSLGMDFVAYKNELLEAYKNMKEEQAMSLALSGYRDNIRLFDKISEALTSRLVMKHSCVVAAAAGNESDRPHYTIAVSPPAEGEFIQSVGAIGLGKNDKPPYVLAEFSNDGAMLAAPGVNVLSAKLGGGLEAMDGTSMATPHVAGVAALWAQAQVAASNFSANDVIRMLASSCVQLPGIGKGDIKIGLVQAPKS